jgi:predicted nucleotidyltransferase component of viral defense system
MIRLIEIQEAARGWGLRPDIVEKDYVISWMLAGLSRHPRLQTEWVFKGGTALKKCYLETYRFSEDLDFTLVPEASQDAAEIAGWVRSVCEWISQASGIELPPELVEFSAAPNTRGTVTLRGKVGYRGPLGHPRLPKLRFDLTTDETLIRPPILRPVHHPYSDAPQPPSRVRCYPLDEILAEKTRAMSDRGRPRDLYDVIRLYRHENLRLEPAAVFDILSRKCAARGLPVPTLKLLEQSPNRAELESEWANMLAHQLPALPPLDGYWLALSDYFNWLAGAAVPQLPAISETEPADLTWRLPDYISLPSAWGAAAPIEAIRFAGANHLLIELNYRPERGRPGVRVVEPYSFRLSQKGYFLFYGRNTDRARISAYRFDRIVDVKVTSRPFRPSWQVEF